MNRVAVCTRENEDGLTLVAVVPRSHMTPPFAPLGLTFPASVVFSDCVAVAARIHCDGTVSSYGPPKNLPGIKAPNAPRRLDPQALKDAVQLFGPFKMVEEFLCVLGLRLLDRPYVMCVSAAERVLELPFGHSIYRVVNVQWVAATPWPTSGDKAPKRPALSKKDANRLAHFLQYDWGELDSLLFSDVIDVCSVFPFGSKPVPSSSTSTSTSSTALSSATEWINSQRVDEFGCDWGKSLRQPFDLAGLGQICSPFTRGYASGCVYEVKQRASSQSPTTSTAASASSSASSTTPSAAISSGSSGGGGPSENLLYFFMMGQQHAGNPGPRFFGRGLNESGQAGNDLVYQLVSWKYKSVSAASSSSSSSSPASPASPTAGWEVHWTRHIYLRGTAPVRFKSKLGKGIGEATIVLMDDALEGSSGYLGDQVMKCSTISCTPCPVPPLPSPTTATTTTATSSASSSSTTTVSAATTTQGEEEGKKKNEIINSNNSSSPAEQQQQKQQPPPRPKQQDQPRLRCINLLKSFSTAGEHKIGALFDQVVKRLSSTGLPIDLEHVDWLGIEAKFGIDAAASAIWNSTLFFLEGHHSQQQFSLCSPCSVGSFPLRVKVASASTSQQQQQQQNFSSSSSSTSAAASSSSNSLSPSSPSSSLYDPAHVVSAQQNRFLRYNCADSLDRTNLASFFVIIQIVNKLFLSLDVTPERLVTKFSANPLLYEQKESPSSTTTPPGTAATGNEQEDTAEEGGGATALSSMPPESELPPCFFHSISDFTENLPEPILRNLVELFVTNGDTIAKLFTATQAIHTSHMRKLVPDMKSATPNAIISAQRRFENVFRDKKKYRVNDIVVGKDTKPHHFPTLPIGYSVWPLPKSDWTRAIVIKVPNVSSNMGVEEIKRFLPVEAQKQVVEIREAVLASGREIDVASANNAITASASPTTTTTTTTTTASATSATSSSSSSAAKSTTTTTSPPLEPSSPSGGAAVLDDEGDSSSNADFLFLKFDHFYVAVVLFQTPLMATSLSHQPQMSVLTPSGDKAIATVGAYSYEVASEESPACLRVRAAAQLASEQSPLAKIGRFFGIGK